MISSVSLKDVLPRPGWFAALFLLAAWMERGLSVTSCLRCDILLTVLEQLFERCCAAPSRWILSEGGQGRPYDSVSP